MMVFRVEHNRHRLRRMQVDVCETRFERGRGLLLRPRLDGETALMLPRCRAIHTIGMHYAIDVLFCDGRGRILSIHEKVGPCRIVRNQEARHVWELASGCARRWGWCVGDRIRPC
jgi:uncharacterized membrane protein (UPF0127 family)